MIGFHLTYLTALSLFPFLDLILPLNLFLMVFLRGRFLVPSYFFYTLMICIQPLNTAKSIILLMTLTFLILVNLTKKCKNMSMQISKFFTSGYWLIKFRSTAIKQKLFSFTNLDKKFQT